MSGFLRLAAAAWVLAAASGCGQKGALYLPDATPQAVKPAPATQTTPAVPAPARRKTPTDPEPSTTQ